MSDDTGGDSLYGEEHQRARQLYMKIIAECAYMALWLGCPDL